MPIFSLWLLYGSCTSCGSRDHTHYFFWDFMRTAQKITWKYMQPEPVFTNGP